MDKNELETKYHELRSCRKVAEYYGISLETIRRRLIEYDIPRVGWKCNKQKTRVGRISAEDVKNILRVFNETKSEKATASALGFSTQTICKWLKKENASPGAGKCQPGEKITDEQILEAVKTMTRQEIADKYGVHVENLARRMKKLGVHAVYDTSVQDKADTWHYSQRCAAFIERCQPEFELVAFKRNRCRLRCKACGNVVERDRSTIKEKHIRCDVCFQRQQEQKLKQAAIAKLLRVFAAIAEKETPKVCPCCGEVFYSEYPSAKWCPRCKTLKGNYRARAKRYGAAYEHGITLRKVIVRDKGICKICGKPVDMNDRSWIHCGPLYPSVDHIIPLARGGAHVWSNVQLAHIMCNSIKGANVEN